MAKEVKMRAFQCETCGKTYGDERAADVCCKVYHCETCGVKTRKYHTMCDSCRKKRDYEKAEKLTIEEYEDRFPGHMVVINDDQYYSDVEGLLCSMENEDVASLEYCWGTEKVDVGLDADEILDGLLEEANCEDLEFPRAAYDEFRAFATAWNEKWSTCYFMPSDVVILIPEEVRRMYIADDEAEAK